MRESGGRQWWLRSWRSAAAGSARRPRPTARESAPRRSSRSATRPSPARRAAGRGTRTAPARASTRSARPPTTTSPAREAIRGCHRSKAAEVHIGDGVPSANLACSGARTSTNAGGSDFKPGIDFYSDASGRKGQALALQQYAATHNVRAVVAADRRQQLRVRRHRADVRDQLADLARRGGRTTATTTPSIKSRFTPARVAAETANVRGAILNVRQAMANAGYARRAVQDPRPDLLVADPARLRLPLPAVRLDAPDDRRLRRLEPRRRLGQRHRRADVQQHDPQRRGAAGLTNVKVVDMANALAGRRLCESSVGLLEERGVANWLTAGAVDKTEWVSQIRTVTTIFGPVPAPGGGPPELLGPAGAAQLPAPGVQRRRRRAAGRARSAGSGSQPRRAE